MAPRKESPPGRDGSNSDGTRNRQFLNANTGAGVNANRPAALRGRGGNSRVRGTSSRGTSGNQRGNQRRAPIPTPGRRLAERLNFDDNRRRRVAEDANNNDAVPEHNEQDSPTNISIQETQISDVGTSQRHQRSALTSTSRTTTPITPRPQPPQARTTTNIFNPFNHASTNATTLSYLISPPPLARAPAAAPRTHHDDTAAANRVFTNPNLRAIMSNKRYPKQRKKALAERPVLKIGLRKEYK